MNGLQRTDAWHQARLGKLTGSRIADATAKTKTGWGASRARYKAQLVTERLTGIPYATFQNAAMAWGAEQEPNAADAYSFARNFELTEVGFVDHPRIAMSGASPDRLVGDDGLVELKAPETHTHLAFLLDEKIDLDYMKQMQWQLAVTGRRWCDFVSYDPRVHLNMQIKIIRVYRDLEMIPALEAQAVNFLEEVNADENELRRKYHVIAEAA